MVYLLLHLHQHGADDAAEEVIARQRVVAFAGKQRDPIIFLVLEDFIYAIDAPKRSKKPT